MLAARTPRSTHGSHSTALGLLALLGAICLLLFLAHAQAAQAATISVNTTNDELNSDGDCSLREAIQASNTNAGVSGCPGGSAPDTDSIILPSGVFTLSIAGANEDLNASGDLDITAGNSVSITGAGAAATIVDGGQLGAVFHIRTAAPTELSALTIRNGLGYYGAGGIDNFASTLTLNRTVVSGNTAGSSYGQGAGINNLGGGNQVTTLILNDSTVSGNHSFNPGIGGGGIFNYYATLILNNSTVANNTANWDGGGINNYGRVTLNDSTVRDNMISAGRGGGIYNVRSIVYWGWEGTVVLNNSAVASNTSTDVGGGVYTHRHARENSGGQSELVLNNSAVSGNTATHGGGIYNSSVDPIGLPAPASVSLNGSDIRNNTSSLGNGGGIYNKGEQAAVTLRGSTVAGNRATAPVGVGVDQGEGGGVWVNKDATLDATDSTISGNSADTNGGGAWSAGTLTLNSSTVSANKGANGGGLHNHGGKLDLTNTTVSGNQATLGGGILDHDVAGEPSGGTTARSSTIAYNKATESGGGILNFLIGTTPGSVTLGNTIVASNTLTNNVPGNCFGPMTSAGYNLSSDMSCSIGSLGDLQDTDPSLGPLEDNGGPTLTHALAAGSPAIDAGPPTPPTGDCPPPTSDQRGVVRPQRLRCDIGAVEDEPDTDSDGCRDGRELGPNAAQGGMRDPTYFWDFADQWTGAPAQRDRSVSGGDIGAVVVRFGSVRAGGAPDEADALAEALTAPTSMSGYHASADRGGSAMGDPLRLLPPDGSISGGDISAVVVQFGHNCLAS
ncbi:MAG: CSLREA domain-containing protein [Solirubrobacterales bacterium]